MKLKDLKTNKDNPRILKDANFKKLLNKILVYPNLLSKRKITYDSSQDNTVLGGNMRLLTLNHISSKIKNKDLVNAIKTAQEKLGIDNEMMLNNSIAIFTDLQNTKEIPSDWIQDTQELSEDEKNAFVLIDNLNDGSWDLDIIANEWDIDVSEWGVVDVFEIENENKSNVVKNDNFHIPEIENDDVDIVLGDLFEIKKDNIIHKLICGDSTDILTFESLMNNKKCQMVFTDPDYSMDFELVKKVYENCNKSSEKIFSFWVCADKQAVKLAINDFDNFSHFFIHDFKMGTMKSGSQAMTQHNMICKFGNRKMNNLKDGFTTILSIATERTLKTHKLTPMSKRIELPFEFIQHYTSENDIVLDAFAHSGSTLIASHQLNRNCYMVEIEPKYCQVILNRIMTFDNEVEVFKNGKKWINTFLENDNKTI